MISQNMERIIALLLVFISTVLSSNPTRLPNVDCAPYIDHVATDPGLYRYIPLYVEMYRCHGKYFTANPKNVKCLPTANGISKVEFYADLQGQVVTLSIDNHTECSQQCVISQDDCTDYEKFNKAECGCTCKISSAAEGKSLCQAPFVWQQSGCNCVCNRKPVACGPRKEFSKEACGCVCKPKIYARCAKRKQVIDENNCLCVEPEVIVGKSTADCKGGVNGVMLAVVILVEAFGIIFCYYFFYVYCYKHNYLGRKNKMNASSGYYHNGDVPNDNESRTNANGNYHAASYEDRYSLTEKTHLTDKERIKQEEIENGKLRLNGISDKDEIRMEEEYPNFHLGNEKSPLAHNEQGSGDYYYNEIMEVDGPPSSLDNHNLNIPPDYSDAISDFSEEGYGSVTQV